MNAIQALLNLACIAQAFNTLLKQHNTMVTQHPLIWCLLNQCSEVNIRFDIILLYIWKIMQQGS